MEDDAREYISDNWEFEPDLDGFMKSIVDKKRYFTYTKTFESEVKGHLLERFNLDKADEDED